MVSMPNRHTLRIDPGDVFDNAGAAANATIVVAAEVSDVRQITITLKDAAGAAIATPQVVDLILLLNATATAFAATGGSTGIAQGADGVILPVVAKKIWKAISKNNGSIKLTWTDTGTEVAYLGVRLPNGKLVISAALTNA